MKRHIARLFLGLGLCQAALGGPSPIYQNFAVITQAPVVDALVFYNQGEFDIDTVTSFNATNLTSLLYENGFSPLPFMTKDTLAWTNSNSGLMIGIPGFRFDTGTSTSRHSASFFLNAGTVEGIDVEGFPYLYSVPGSTSEVPVPAASQPIASQILVLATNIVNSGAMTVGNAGLVRLSGNNVTNAYGTLAAGFVSTVGLTNFEEDATGFQGQDEALLFNNGPYFFFSSLDVYDLFWGVTNGENVFMDGLSVDLPEGIPNYLSGERGLLGVPEIPLNFDTAQYSVSATAYAFGTNIYYNLVFVNTNFADTNLSATVGFGEGEFVEFASTTTNVDPNADEVIVQFAEPVYDVITGQTVTNGVYLIDDGALLPTMSLAVDASSPAAFVGPNVFPTGYSRPNAFELTTVTPPEWLDTTNGDFGYIPDFIYATDEFASNKDAVDISEYGAQIGHNPASLSGTFSTLVAPGSDASLFLQDLQVNLPDPTNGGGRIEINAGNLDMTQARLRAEGMVILNVTNLTGGPAAGMDWGEANASIGATNGALVVSNMFPSTFQRVRGNIYAVCATWRNVQTNLDFGNTNTPATNLWHYHVLVVDQNLYGTFPSTVRNLVLTGTQSIVLQDGLTAINTTVFNTTNLTVNSSNYFSQNAANFTPATTPTLQNLLITTNGLLSATGYLDVGYNVNNGVSSPVGRHYTVNTITNFGQLLGTAPLFQSAIFENDGQIISENGGSILIQAGALGLGLAMTNITNSLLAVANIELSAATIEASNSIISAGLAEPGSLTIDATTALTDFVSGTPTTNTNSVIINHWTVTGGFNLLVKPATGDLFGTEIRSIATNIEEITHVWAGADMGATPAGFVNNAVIGRLVLDRQSANSVLRFSAAGAANAMYVDYLELTNFAYTNYRTGLIIDPNFTIYFAACNADPEKLMEVYPGLKWVQNFAGPNSTLVVPYINSSNVCLMNINLAQSFEISFFNGLPNYYNQPFVLNDPSNPTNIYPCPGDETALRSLLVATPVPGQTNGTRTLNLVNISVNGKGRITPALGLSQMALGLSYSLTATPAGGWVFQNWSTIGLPGAINANSPILSFSFLSNTLITANFIPNPFGSLQGVYNGLFFETNAVNPGSSGAFTLALASSGSFSGRLLMGPSAYSFSSRFSGAGGAQLQAKSGAQSLTLDLQLDTTGQTGQILGEVKGAAWDAPLAADIAPVWTSKSPSPLAGSYTMVLQESSVAGFGAGTVNKQGVLTIAGALADGASFSASAPVSKDGQWPFYAYAAAGKDSILGWVSVSNGLAGTSIAWSKAAGKGPLYAAGFTNILQLEGSPWQAPAKKSSALTLTDPVVNLSGGGLAEPLTIGVALHDYLAYTATNLTFTINPATGGFSGWFYSPGSGRRQTVSGVVLQNAGSASGFFQGADESGTVLLENQN